MFPTKPILLTACYFLINSAFAATPNPSVKPVRIQTLSGGGQFINQKDWNFTENKGQVASSDIKYYGHQGGVYLYCKPGMLSFVFTKTEMPDNAVSEATGTTDDGVGVQNPEPLRGKQRSSLSALRSSVTTNRADLILLNSNPDAQILASNQQEYYENYYTTGDADHGITNVHTFKTITYKDIYPHIDMVLHAKESGMKYEFVVHPSGKVSDIQMRWNGLQNMQMTENGGIKYAMALGEMKENKPVSFTGATMIQSSFVKNGNIIRFKVEGYDERGDLVVDPNLVWGTYFGGKDDDEAYGISTDTSGNVYIAGSTSSTSGIATSGAYHSSYGGGNLDAFLAKFSSTGTLFWSTYFGGKGDEIAQGVSVDTSGNIYITGTTGSDSGLSTTGVYQTSYGGNIDAFLAKFSSAGTLTWSTYYGGWLDENPKGISMDVSGNIYIAGFTPSIDAIATSGAYQTSRAGNYDVFLAKFSSGGGLYWATYYGGSDDDYAYGVTTDGSGNVFISGYTGSNTGIATTGAYQSFNSGSSNAFLAKFSSTGDLSWATYYGGRNFEFGQGVCTDKEGNVYMAGYAHSKDGVATSGTYQTSFGGGNADAFLAKFSSSGMLSWGTYYGGSGDDFADEVSTDGSGNVYITGKTTSDSGIATYGAYQTSYGGGSDAFLAKFSSAGALHWATYYGGDSEDYPRELTTFGSSNIYLTGFTTSTSGIASSGTYKTSYGGGIYDAFLAKFHFFQNDAGIDSIKKPSGRCPGSQTVRIILKNYGISALISDSIYWNVNGTLQTPVKWKGSLKSDSSAVVTLGSFNFLPGTSIIKVWSTKPNGVVDSMPDNDTSKINFTPDVPAAAIISDTAICSGTAISIGDSAVVGSNYYWTSLSSGFISSSSNPIVSPVSTTTYIITETNKYGCKKSDSVTIIVNPIPMASVIANTAICSGSTIYIGYAGAAGSSYLWASSPSGFTSSFSDPIVSPDSTTKYFLNETSSNGCVKSDSVTITVNSLPTAAVISDTEICSGTAISIGDIPVSGSSYSWNTLPFGPIPSSSNPIVSPDSTKTYILTVTNSNGCTKSDSVTITVNSLAKTVISNTAICSGSSISIGGTSVLGNSYSWVSTPSGFTSSSSNPTVTPLLTTKYKLTETNLKGCSGTDSVIIIVDSLPKSGFSSTDVCFGDSSVFADSSHLANSYLWYFGDGSTSSSANPKHLYSAIGYYTVSLKVTSSGGCTDSVSKKLSISNCVWPGDANDDKVVDMKDFLAVGIAFGDTGLPRPSASITWTGQPCPDWKDTIPGGINAKYSDCNGDSIVNYTDTIAIANNYGLSHTKTSPLDQGSPSDPGFIITPISDSVSIGKTFQASISIGNQKNPVQNLYGIAFSIAADPSLFEIDKASIKIIPSFFGTDSVDVMGLKINNNSSSSTDLGLTRIDHKNVSGYGSFAILSIPVKASISQKNIKTALSVSNNTQISFNGKNIPLYFSSDSVVVTQHTSAINPVSQFLSGINIYPNPFSVSASVQYTLLKPSKLTIGLFDLTGKEIGIIQDGSQQTGKYTLDISAEKYHLTKGVYMLKFITEDGYVSRKIVKF